ncbi:hypothetical protein [Staphylococcus equorum]
MNTTYLKVILNLNYLLGSKDKDVSIMESSKNLDKPIAIKAFGLFF